MSSASSKKAKIECAIQEPDSLLEPQQSVSQWEAVAVERMAHGLLAKEADGVPFLVADSDDDEETTPAIAAAETASPVRRGGSHAADDKVQPKPPLPSPVGYKRGKDLPPVVF